MSQPLTVKPGTKIRLDEYDPADRGDFKDKLDAAERTQKNIAKIDELSYRLYAENTRSLLIILQGMDTAGKDGTIRKVMTGINPQTCVVRAFKRPGYMELDHDFLWRIHQAVPPRGNVGIFNRSHYEDVLVVRVHQLVPEKEWRGRYERINEFERMLTEGGMSIVKVFLHISKDEQKERLQARLDDPTKRWKFSKADIEERNFWDDYQRAYDDALSKCNTEHAPWYIVPANRKWYRDYVVSQIIRQRLEELDPQFPAAEEGLEHMVVQ